MRFSDPVEPARSKYSESGPSKSVRSGSRTFQAPTGNKIAHIKKRDGEPLWRVDIQYDFLSAIFTDSQAVFTSSYTGEQGFTFADLYIDSMARSSKCSRILSDKLLGDRRGGLSIAMVCLLVNVGRMNTTLNFFPEMKAQLRTYHPIPSLQSAAEPEYKQLQDAPRLKSILKGACEDRNEPATLNNLMAENKRPATNPINLVFLLSTYAPRVSELFFPSSIQSRYYDLFMDNTLSSQSRARAFLWLVWAFLETDLSPEQLIKNPFGQRSTHIPPLVPLDEAEFEKENVDTPGEITFGAQMTLQRLTYLEGHDKDKDREKRERDRSPSAGLAKEEKIGAKKARMIAFIGAPPAWPKAPLLRVPEPITVKDRREMREFRKLLNEKRERRQQHRRLLANPVEATWKLIRDLDPVYDSDADFNAYESFDDTPASIRAANLSDGIGDYGDYVSSVFKAVESTALLLKKSGVSI